MQILVVDDDHDINTIIALTLRIEGHDVRQAYEGKSALRMVSEKAPDLILLDMMMPGMSGIDVAHALYGSPTSTNIPIVFCSAKCDPGDSEAALAVTHAVDYICKPFAPQDLISRVDSALQ
ncbi:MAG TPA: response regulator [Abditibacteriaceae bacterium]|jgi:CheY-like chemotaxis protein